jgi:hypothetical protein
MRFETCEPYHGLTGDKLDNARVAAPDELGAALNHPVCAAINLLDELREFA